MTCIFTKLNMTAFLLAKHYTMFIIVCVSHSFVNNYLKDVLFIHVPNTIFKIQDVTACSLRPNSVNKTLHFTVRFEENNFLDCFLCVCFRQYHMKNLPSIPAHNNLSAHNLR